MKKLLTNNKNNNFYNLLTSLLRSCKKFYINVAFINYSGIQLLLDSFKICEQKKIKGKILTSTYLNFTEAKALEKIQNFKNIELKIFDSSKGVGFHSKAYIFEFETTYIIIIGSSNITASAFKSNIEWNVKVVSKKNEEFALEVLEEFDFLYKKAYFVDNDFLNSYKKFLIKTIFENRQKFIFKEEIKPNSIQKKTLKNLEYLRSQNQTKALAICATGTGKTYLSAFDVKNFGGKKVLFLAHRENILITSKNSFSKIIKNKTLGLFTGNKNETEKQILFSTIQMMNKKLNSFEKEEFDYIIYDEAHHIRSNTFQKVFFYFKPKFSLGLTATPNRTDNQNIYEIFDDNIAVDIRVNEALEKRLISPFHYFGIDDIKIDYKDINLDNISELAKLVSVHKRVDFIVEKLDFYGHDGGKRKALAFCVDTKHAKFMCKEFNKRGITSVCLLGFHSISKREEMISKIQDEDDNLEVIFSIDIFNEGIDIPKINTILMLRPTASATIFTQQLGRGLRKNSSKEYLTVLDFIGNHDRAYIVVLALLGDKKIDKDSLKVALNNNFSNISNDSYIFMDEICKKRVLKQIDEQNFSTLKHLKQQYFSFKTIVKSIPSLIDFITYENAPNPKNFIHESKSYIQFIQKVEKIEEKFTKNFYNVMGFLDSHINLKRIHEFIILKYLLSNNYIHIKTAKKELLKYQEKVYENTIENSFRYLNQDFFDKLQIKKYEKIVHLQNKVLKRSELFTTLLENEKQKQLIKNSIDYGILLYEKEFGKKYYGLPFLKLYEKYNMKNIALLCNLDKIHSSFRGSGQLKYKNDYFLFINLNKENAIKSKKYKNIFLSKDTFTWQTKPSATQDKGDGQKLIQNKKHKIKLHIFVRKFVLIDKKTQNFIYLGFANTINYKGEKPINLTLKLEIPLTKQLFDEFTIIT